MKGSIDLKFCVRLRCLVEVFRWANATMCSISLEICCFVRQHDSIFFLLVPIPPLPARIELKKLQGWFYCTLNMPED